MVNTTDQEILDRLVKRFDEFLTKSYSDEEVRGLILGTDMLYILRLKQDKQAQWLVLAHRILRAETLGDPVLASKRWLDLAKFEDYR